MFLTKCKHIKPKNQHNDMGEYKILPTSDVYSPIHNKLHKISAGTLKKKKRKAH